MNITLEQARTLDAFARAGTLQGAAAALRKAHSAVLYGLGQLEAQTGLTLLDRSGYRNRLTPAGHAVLADCRRMLASCEELARTCERLKSGWEPTLRLVVDAIYPVAPLLAALTGLKARGSTTRVVIEVDALERVGAAFEAERADLMIGVLPVTLDGVTVHRLPRLSAHLVVGRSHPLARTRGKVSAEALAEHVLVTVRGSDPRLALPTANLEKQSTVQLSDFHAKREAILTGLGFGWLPDWLIATDLERGRLVALRGHPAHAFEPRLAHRGSLGRAGQLLLEAVSPRT